MQVKPIIPLAPSVLKELSAGVQPAEQAAAVDKLAAEAAGKLEIVAQIFPKLEKAVLQWFLAQRPELAKALAQLFSLQEQLSAGSAGVNTGSTDNAQADNVNEKLIKILDMMKMLLISPQRENAAKSSVLVKSPPALLVLLGDLAKLKKEQSPEMQTKIDIFVAKLTKLLQDMESTTNLSDAKQKAQQQRPETPANSERTSRTADNAAPKDAHLTSKNTATGNLTDGRPIPKQESLMVTAKTEIRTMDEEAGADLSKAQNNFAGRAKAHATAPNEVQGQKDNRANSDDAGLMQPSHPGKSRNVTPRSSQGADLGNNAALLPEDEFNPGALPKNNQNTPEFMLSRPINNAAVMQQKLQELLLQFTEKLDQQEPGDKLRAVLQDIAKCIKALQINPEKDWENLLRYPVIYKQTLHKAVNLLQELINIKQSDKVHKNTAALLSEIIANLHVQTSVNQLRQENPATQTMYFQIPLQIGDEIKNGEMLVVHEREKQGNKWEIVNSWYRFYLETQYLKQVQINLHAANKQLNIQFILADETCAGIFDAQKSALQLILTQHGYDVAGITCDVGAVAPLFLFDTDGVDRKSVDIMI